MMIDTGPIFYSVPSLPPCMTLGQGHRLRTFMLTFYVKVFRISLFPNPLMDLVHLWYNDRYWSKILHSVIPDPIHDFKVKVTDLELLSKFCVKVFRTSLFPNPLKDLVYIWYDDRYWSKILFSTIPTPMHDLKVKVTDLKLLC